MACNFFGGKTKDGGPFGGFACGPRRKMKSCAYCSRPHTLLCDFKAAIEGGWKIKRTEVLWINEVAWRTGNIHENLI